MRQLVLHCQFVAHSYQGQRQRSDQRDELDWPPAPARLHQALIAVALAGRPAELKAPYAGPALDALRWLEKLPPPEIVATRVVEDEVAGRRPQVALPHNSPSKKRGLVDHEVYLAPARLAVSVNAAPLEVSYLWFSEKPDFLAVAKKYLAALGDLTAQLRYLGRGEDRVEANVLLTARGNTADVPDHCAIWRPVEHFGDVELYRARPRSTEELEAAFKSAHLRLGRIAKTPARRFFDRQGYQTEAVEGLRPVHVAIFQLFSDSGDPDESAFACDPENAHRWRSSIREAAIQLAEDQARWDDPALAYELITGHQSSEQVIVQEPHLAFVPLPSLSASGKADGRVRRFALLGYAEANKATSAVAMYQVLAASLNGEQLTVGRRSLQLRQLEGPIERDKMWAQFAGTSYLWHSVTPVAIARRFKVPKLAADGNRKLTSNERHLRRLQELEALLRASLHHIRLPDDIAAGCSITLTASPLLVATRRAENYRVPGETAVLSHARLQFPHRVRGPLLVGDRRYKGFGLFFPT